MGLQVASLQMLVLPLLMMRLMTMMMIMMKMTMMMPLDAPYNKPETICQAHLQNVVVACGGN
jgi:hypothetical protein